MAFAFEKLVVCQKSVDFADAICQRTEQFPRGYRFLVDQRKRAALSIATSIADGRAFAISKRVVRAATVFTKIFPQVNLSAGTGESLVS